MIEKIAVWYANGGKITLLKIVFILFIIVTVQMALGGIIGSILLMRIDIIGGGLCLLLLGVPIITFINLVLLGLLKGEIYWTEKATYGYSKASVRYKTSTVSASAKYNSDFQKSQEEQRKLTESQKLKKQEDDLKRERIEEEKQRIDEIKKNLANEEIVFSKNYFATDTKGNHIRIPKGTVAKVINKKPSGAIDIEYEENGKTIKVEDVMPYNI